MSSSNFPGALDTTVDLPDDTTNANTLANPDHATLHNVISDAVIAVETKLGTGDGSFPSDGYVLTGTGAGSADWALLSTNGVYYNVQAYGAKGDGTTDDTAAIQAAIVAATEGSIVLFPPGTYRVSSPIFLLRNRTYMGTQSPRWEYRGGAPCVIAALPSFSGAAVVYIADKEILNANGFNVGSNDTDGGRITNLAVTGNNYGSGIPGILFQGLTRDWEVYNVDSSNTSGDGWQTTGYVSVDLTTHYPRGLYLVNPSTYLAHNIGFSFNNLTDSTVDGGLAVQATSIGWLIDTPGECKYIGCRSVFNGSDGLRIQGAATVGGVQFVGFSTDRNQNYGVKIIATGNQPIVFTNLLTRRDGKNSNSGGGNLAGLAVLGTNGSTLACPVIVEGLAQTVGLDDGAGSGNYSPEYGIQVNNASYVTVSGTAWGVTNAVNNLGTNTQLDFSGLVRFNGTSPSRAVDTASLTTQALPTGGTSGQFLVKNSSTDWDTSWIRSYNMNASDIGLVAWNYDPISMSTGAGVASGTLYVCKLFLPVTATITNIRLRVSTGGSSLTSGDSIAALYNGAGTLLSATADQSSSWTSAGLKTIALSSAQSNAAAGTYYVAFWSTGTTPPQFGCGTNSSAVNGALSTANSRFATANTGLTNTAPSTLGAFTASNISFWAGLS